MSYFRAILLLLTIVLIPFKLEATEYKYDALGRLALVTYDDGKKVEYKYDAAGNRTAVEINGSGSTNTSPIAVNDVVGALTWRLKKVYPLVNDSDQDGDNLIIESITATGCNIGAANEQIAGNPNDINLSRLAPLVIKTPSGAVKVFRNGT
ncbi:MAG: Ig-like domain-containing protein, partial [Kangiellaceae bacterium]|nr:Ig-like domain-containing protein [Kangiellaceae bacterium]